MKSLDRGFLEQQSIPLEFAGTLRLLGEYRGKQELYTRQTPQVLNTLRQVAIIQSTESSNRIEGIEVEEKRLRLLLEKGATPENRSEAEVLGYKNVLSQIHISHDRFSITPETILKIHRDMLSRTALPAGMWKTKDNTIEERLREFEDRVGIIGSSRGAKTAQVLEAIEHLPETFSAGDVSRACPGVSRPMIRVVLESLRREGKVEVLATGRGAKWRKRDNVQ